MKSIDSFNDGLERLSRVAQIEIKEILGSKLDELWREARNDILRKVTVEVCALADERFGELTFRIEVKKS